MTKKKEVLILIEFENEAQLKRLFRFLRKRDLGFEVWDLKKGVSVTKEEFEEIKRKKEGG